MKKNPRDRLHDLLVCLKKEERKRFSGWLHNELQGRQADMWDWFELVWEEKSYEEAWQMLRADQPLDKAQVNRWNTSLIDWLESYLAICAFREDPFAHHLYLSRAVIRRDPIQAYPSTIRKSRKHLRNQAVRDRSYYRIQHELDRLDGEFSNLYPGIQIRRYQPKSASIQEHEELATLLTNIEVVLRRLNAGELLTELDRYSVVRLRVYAESENPEQWPVAYLYLRLFDYLDSKQVIPTEEAQSLVSWYQSYYQTLRPDAQFLAFTFINNVIIRSYYRQDNPDLIPLVFACNVWIIDHTEVFGLRYFYRNVIQFSLFLSRQASDANEKQDYLRQAYVHLEELKPKLPADEQDEAYTYNLAYLYFEQGQFAQLSKQLYSQTFKDYTYEISYLILWNKAKYELGEWEGLRERLNNIQLSLRHTLKLRPDFKKRQINQVKYFQKLVANHRPGILKRLRNQLEADQFVIGKKWLLEKLDDRIERAR